MWPWSWWIDLCRTYIHSLMHCYEVIPEGTVCKLYFDLEFHKPSNKGADGKTMVSRLIQVRCFSNFHVTVFIQVIVCWAVLLHIQQLYLPDLLFFLFFQRTTSSFVGYTSCTFFLTFPVCLWQADGGLWYHMYQMQCPEPRLQHRGEVQSASHL